MCSHGGVDVGLLGQLARSGLQGCVHPDQCEGEERSRGNEKRPLSALEECQRCGAATGVVPGGGGRFPGRSPASGPRSEPARGRLRMAGSAVERGLRSSGSRGGTAQARRRASHLGSCLHKHRHADRLGRSNAAWRSAQRVQASHRCSTSARSPARDSHRSNCDEAVALMNARAGRLRRKVNATFRLASVHGPGQTARCRYRGADNREARQGVLSMGRRGRSARASPGDPRPPRARTSSGGESGRTLSRHRACGADAPARRDS